MMKIIFNHDGSIKLITIPESIQQGNDGVDEIYLEWEGYSNSSYSCDAVFTLPNGSQNTLVAETSDNGYLITLTSAQTVYAGKLLASFRLKDLNTTLFSYQYEFQVNPTNADIDETTITIAQYNSIVQAMNSYLSLDGGEMNGDAHILLKKESEDSFIYPYIRIQNADGDVRTTLQYDRVILTGSDVPNRPESTVYYNGTIDVGQNTLKLPEENGTLATREWSQQKLYRHHLYFTGDGGYAVNFELINKTSSSMTISGNIDSNNVLTFSNVSSEFAHLRYVMATSAEQYLIVSMNFVYSTTTTGTLKMKVYRIQNDGTLSPITTYTTLNDTVEAL